MGVAKAPLVLPQPGLAVQLLVLVRCLALLGGLLVLVPAQAEERVHLQLPLPVQRGRGLDQAVLG